MSNKRKYKPGYQSYFVTIVLEQTVHVVGLGFTDTVYRYVIAKDNENAEQIAANYYKGQKLSVTISQAVKTVFDVLKNTFPEHVLGFEEGTLAC